MTENPKHCIVSLFADQPCWTIASLSAELEYSIPSVRRFLRELGYYSSFTHNGRWYTLHTIPQFDRDGLWFYQDIGFSRTGSLPKTLINLVNRSPSGMSADQLGEKLQSRCHTVLVQLWRQEKIQRWKSGSSHIYISADSNIAKIQNQTHLSFQVTSLPAELAVLVLVEFIHHPKFSFEQLAEAISRTRRVTVHVSQIMKLFKEHNIKKSRESGCKSFSGAKPVS